MATRAMGTEAIANGTGREWSDWLAWLDGIGAKDLSHKEIARRVKAEGATGWWAQYVAVAYEQHIGRRVPGQNHTGTFQVAASKTVAGSMDDAIALWKDLVEGVSSFDGVSLASEPRASETEKWRHWRVDLADGTRVMASATDKAGGKSTLTVTHEKLAARDDIERWRPFWKDFLAGK